MTELPADRFAHDPDPRLQTFRIVDCPALSAELDQTRASLREQLRIEQPWRRDILPPEGLPTDPFAG